MTIAPVARALFAAARSCEPRHVGRAVAGRKLRNGRLMQDVRALGGAQSERARRIW
jgi:hypothetical protein